MSIQKPTSLKVFTHQDQLNFAQLSGDYNPMHISPVAARRLMYGKQVVHGVHGLLWALDQIVAELDDSIRLTSIKVVFPKAVKIYDTEISFAAERVDEQEATIVVKNGQDIFQQITLQWEPVSHVESEGYAKNNPPDQPCKTPDIHAIEGVSGEFDLYFNAEKGMEMFPMLTRHLAHKQIAHLLASTRLVGMILPGLHSIFSELEFHFTEVDEHETRFTYSVANVVERFNLVRLSIECSDVMGTIAAFFRPESVQQLRFEEAKTRVGDDAFKGQRVLVIGGSRGIGEVTTKLLAAGGADVTFTYHSGKEDARFIVEETENRTTALAFNVLGDDHTELVQRLTEWKPTHLYYYATPFIETSDTEELNERIYQKFASFYVTGFEKLMYCLDKHHALPEAVFYPSSVFVSEAPSNLKEYAKAKVEGEAACKKWEQQHSATKIYAPRIPKVDTDQTASLFDSGSVDTTEVTLNFIKNFVANT
ncbi:MAG: MaoC/PaaZ C-terminal domain-containing protein [Balneolaceae bacterium]